MMAPETKTASGELVTVRPVHRVPEHVAVHGMTMQNLWVNPTGTRSGVTAKSNDDGSITLSGTATSDAYIFVASYSLKPGSIYTLSVDKSTDGRGFYVQSRAGSGSIGTSTYVGGTEGTSLSASFTIASGAEFAYLGFGAEAGTTVSGTYRVMLREATEDEIDETGAFEWCPPGIWGAADVFGSKRNLIESFGGSSNGITATGNHDGTLSLKGEPETNAMFQIGTVSPLEPGKTYTVSIDSPIAHEYVSGSSGACLYLNVPASDGGYGTDHIFGFGDSLSTTFTVPSSVTLTTLRISCIAHQDVTGTYKVMLNEGTTAAEWAPPGMRHTELSVVTAGKNLWDNPSGTRNGVTLTSNKDGSITLEGTATSDAYIFVASYSLKPGSIYTLSVDKSTDGRGFYVQPRDGSGLIGNAFYVGGTIGTDLSNYFTVPSNADYVNLGFGVNSGTTVSGTYRVMLNEGDAVEPWEPSTVSETPIDMQGHALYSLPSGMRDELRIDSDGKITKVGNVGHVTVTAEFQFVTVLVGSDIIRVNAEDRSVAFSDGDYDNTYCDKFISGKAGVSFVALVSSSNNMVSVYVPKSIASTDEEAIAFVKSMCPFNIVYSLAKSVETDLGTVDLPRLPSPLAYVCAVSDVPCELSLGYKEYRSEGAGIEVAGLHSYYDMGQLIASRNTGAPEKKTSTKTVPYMSGFWDFSKVYGALAYESREVTYTVELLGEDREDLQDQKSALMAWLLEIHDEPIYDDDIPGFHFVGSCSGVEWDEGEEGESGTLTVKFLCQPFLEADDDTTVTVPVGSGTVNNHGQTVNPTAKTASGSATIILGGVTQSVSTTPTRLSGQLLPGDNSVTVSGAEVTLSWRKQRL